MITELIQTLKDVVISITDLIDAKLQTKTGRMALLAIGSIILGGAGVHSCNTQTNYESVLEEKIETEKQKDSLQGLLNNHIKNADKDCNEKIKQGALLQQQLQYIYSHKIEENKEFIDQQREIVREKERVLTVQEDNINKLQNLNE